MPMQFESERENPKTHFCTVLPDDPNRLADNVKYRTDKRKIDRQ